MKRNPWEEHRKKLHQYLKTRNIKCFRFWDVIRQTMVVLNPLVLIKEVLELIGNIHQRYHLLQLTRTTDIDFRDLDTIIEIGGGYGAMCASIYDKGFHGKYIIYDIPEMLKLQRYYIEKRGIDKNILYTSNIDDIRANPFGSLLIALWSLSEMPMELRSQIFTRMQGFHYYLYGFQCTFDGVDNMNYFKWLTQRIKGQWTMMKINHIRNDNYYLIKDKEYGLEKH